jgi:hypothetical protein
MILPISSTRLLIARASRVAVISSSLLLGSSAAAQSTLSLEGTVRDTTGAALPHARVDARGEGPLRSVTADEDGRYRIDGLAPGRYTVTAAFDGFAPTSATIDAGRAVTSVDLTFTRLATAESLTVTAALGRRELDSPTPVGSRLGLTPRETPATVDVITFVEAQERGLRTALEALSSVPAVTAAFLPSAQGITTIRGFSGGAVSQLFDGTRVTTSTIVARNYDSWSFDRIEVLKGPASVLYGGGALAGAVNFAPKRRTVHHGGGVVCRWQQDGALHRRLVGRCRRRGCGWWDRQSLEMGTRIVVTALAVLAMTWLPGAVPVAGQTVFAPPAEPLRLAASHTFAPLRVDGVLDEPEWAEAAVARDFTQAEPTQGNPATEPTEVRVLFDGRFLYFGVTCVDSHGEQDLRVRDLRRDFDEATDDYFGVAIDGVRDGRSALVFRVNPLGALRDQQTVDGGLIDLDFDAVWTARTTRSDGGWTVEIAIPWDTLRYREGVTTWGINFQRMTRRINENSGWSPWPRVVTPYRMDYAGLLTGVEPPPPSRNLRFLPYVIGERRDANGRSGFSTGDVGADVKWAVTPSAVLDVTVNPDFGQTDVDRQVVNLTRFSVFFPERRQFFLENRALFFSGNGQRFEPFFSRRIGLDVNGNPIPITAGARFSVRHRAGAFGALAVSQRGTTDATESTPFDYRPSSSRRYRLLCASGRRKRGRSATHLKS